MILTYEHFEKECFGHDYLHAESADAMLRVCCRNEFTSRDGFLSISKTDSLHSHHVVYAKSFFTKYITTLYKIYNKRQSVYHRRTEYQKVRLNELDSDGVDSLCVLVNDFTKLL